MRSRPAGRRWSSHRARTPARPAAAAVLAAALLAAAAGCGRPPGPSPALAPPAPAARAPRPGYIARVDSLPARPEGLLAGRRIALDPGHGGWFRGALGVGGLTEAEVNLGVSLRLAALLRAAGAEVLLTRETDRDFLTPADSSLRADLAERVRLANAWKPDVFLSVHHNADPGARHDVNETQVYHALGDDGPALEMAEDVHRSLTRNLGIEISRLIPGNFFVVRHSEAPALLSEASHITYPPTEARLREPSGQQLEAEALYLGLLRYFARRAPGIAAVRVDGATAGDSAMIVTTGRPEIEADVRGAADAVDLRLNGRALAPERSGSRVRWRPAEPLAHGAHELTLRARLAGEGTSRTRRVLLRVTKPAHRLAADTPRQAGWRRGEPVALRVRVLDRDGLAMADSARVRVRTRGASPADTLVIVAEGEARATVWPADNARAGGAIAFEVTLEHSSAVPAVRLRLAPAAADAPRTAILTTWPDGTPWRGRVPEAARSWLDRDGFVTGPSPGRPWRQPALAGHRAAGAAEAWPPRVVAIADGVFHGRRIALDPEGGGDDAAGLGPSGTRASSLNLQVARALAAMLEAAGAEVLLVREGETTVPEVTRVRLAEGFGAERYLRIAHRPGAPSAGHYFSSGGGRRWAARLAALAPRLGLDSVAVGESARYPIAQVSAVALDASLARIDRDESRLLAPGTLRAEAHALYAALAADLLGRDLDVDSVPLTRSDATPAAHARVSAGGVLLLQADASGVVRIARTEAAPITLEALDPPR